MYYQNNNYKVIEEHASFIKYVELYLAYNENIMTNLNFKKVPPKADSIFRTIQNLSILTVLDLEKPLDIKN